MMRRRASQTQDRSLVCPALPFLPYPLEVTARGSDPPGGACPEMGAAFRPGPHWLGRSTEIGGRPYAR